MIRRAFVGLGGAAIGAVLGWTIAAFTGWTLAIPIVATLFGLLAVWSAEQKGTVERTDDLNRPTTLFPPPDERR